MIKLCSSEGAGKPQPFLSFMGTCLIFKGQTGYMWCHEFCCGHKSKSDLERENCTFACCPGFNF